MLEENLGPIQALRFLALISRQPFNYQQWRQQYFGTMKLAEILTQAQLTHEDSRVQKAGGSRKNKEEIKARGSFEKTPPSEKKQRKTKKDVKT